MIKKLLSVLFAAIMFVGIFSFIPYGDEPALAASNPFFKNTITTTETPSMEKVIIKVPRKISGATYTHLLGKDTNKSKVVFVKNERGSDYNTLTISPLKEGTTTFALGSYHYNGSTRDCVLMGVVLYKVTVEKGEDGKLRITNLHEDMTEQNAYIFTGNKATERYDDNKFVALSRSFNDTTESFTKTNSSFSGINSLIQTYKLDRYYRPEYHIHNYSNGKCTTCGDSLNDYSNNGFPAVFGNVCPQQGETKSVTYKNVNFLVYTPYGYNDTNQYNVLILLHGKNGTQNDWLIREQASEGLSKTTGKNLFDWAIYRGNVAPFIAVSVRYVEYRDENGNNTDATYQKLSKNLTEIVLPYIIKNYGTYAEGSTDAKLIAAREHFAIAGLSLGGTAVEKIGFIKNDYYKAQYYGTKIVLSGYIYGDKVCQYYKASGYTSDSVYFINGGKSDGNPYVYMARWKDSDTPAGTKFYRLSYTTGHTWKTWHRGIMYALQTMWR